MLLWLLVRVPRAVSDDLEEAWAQVKGAIVSNVLSVGYATHAFEGFCLSVFSELYHGMQPILLGFGRDPGAGLGKFRKFRAVTYDKIKETRSFVEWLAQTAAQYHTEPPLVYVHDSGDILQLRDASCIAEGHSHEGRPILWAAERWFYVGWNGSREFSNFQWLEPLYPELPLEKSVVDNGARYLNAGAYVGQVQALVEMYSKLLDLKPTLDADGNVLAHEGHLYFEHNGTRQRPDARKSLDQALTSFYYITNLERYGGHGPIALDHESRTFECMHERQEDIDFTISEDGTFRNSHTGSRPCMLHFNGPKGARLQRVASKCRLRSEAGLAKVLAGKVILWRPNDTDVGFVRQVSYSELCPSYDLPGVPQEFLHRLQSASVSGTEL